MHIKQIRISNFRSFQSQGLGADEIPNFHESTNTIVGRNGTGKSNLLDAIQFCLLSTSKWSNALRHEERQALLHEGPNTKSSSTITTGTTTTTSHQALSAFVEVVLDNRDHRFMSCEQDEVVIRRVISLKKDEMFLQRKRVPKSHILNVLEGAGFSKSNPYYLVQQGQIQALCLMNDSERLNVLKEVAGTTVYDSKKQESLQQMHDNQDKITKVQDILIRIEERLEELNDEKSELEQYTIMDKQRKSCEYCLYERELHKSQLQLSHLEEERAQHATTVAQLHEDCKVSHYKIRNVEGMIHTKQSQVRHVTRHIQQLEVDVKERRQQHTQYQLEYDELQRNLQASQEAHVVATQQLQLVQRQIDTTQSELEQLTPQWQSAKTTLANYQQQRHQATQALEAFHAKQGRGKQFANKHDRDQYLQTQVDQLQSATTEKHATMTQHQETLASSRRMIQTLQVDQQQLQQQIQHKSQASTSLHKQLLELRQQRQKVQETRKSDWRRVEQLRDQVREARHDWQQCMGDRRKTMPKATALGLQALETLIDQLHLKRNDQIFGTVLDNFTLKHDKYAIAVEVAAQNSLFHVIVRDDEVAAQLLAKLEQDKLGRVTFLPLNQLRVDSGGGDGRSGNAIPPGTTDVCSLLETCIQYDPMVHVAMQHVFGNKLLAKSQEAASEWSNKCDQDAITLDGDCCSRKGAISGGYVDTSKSRYAAHIKLQHSKTKLDQLQAEYRQANQQAEQADQQTSMLMQDIQKLEAKHGEVNTSLTSLETSLERLQLKIDQQKQQQDKLETTVIPGLERDIENLQAEQARIEQEMGTELVETLSSDDVREMNRLKQQLASLKEQIESQREVVAQLAAEHQKTHSLLHDNLLKRKEELTEGVGIMPSAEGDDDDEEEEDDDEDVTAPVEDLLSPQLDRRRSTSQLTKSARLSRRGRRRSSVAGRLSLAAQQEQREQELRERKAQLEDVTRVLDELQERLKEARQSEAALRAELIEAKNELESLRTADAKNSKLLDEAQEKSERLLNKRSMYIAKKELYSQKIQELGSLPPPAELEKFSGKSISDLTKELEAINKKLKKFSHVNKKAFDQFVNFNDQRESLLKRKDELDQGSVKIQELIESLDQQKDEAINRTFRGVSAHFKDVFSELVPSGAGELIMRTAIDEGDGGTDEEQDDSDDNNVPKKSKNRDPNNPEVSLYRGIGIKVRFSEVGENYMMSQLSGGQKALVALALIFAIQRCDPAPFYIFDELDQALDSSYRAAVANLIERQANSKENPTQFIVTTFRPELVRIANRCYGIGLQNKVSNLHYLQKRDALNFVASLMSEEEAVGEVRTIGKRASLMIETSSRKRKSVADEHESEDAEVTGADDELQTRVAGHDDEDDATSAEHDSP